ncbi:MAG TPA: hypothetical protein VHD32_10880 [Candidatus Didemnitutus sp.]|nr:hypothetical protein [Candidatus Didemnitutus sp.]
MTHSQVNRISWAIVAIGAIAAAVIFFTAPPVDDNPMLGDPLANKRYLSEMKRIGGSANVLASDFREWLSDQWQGRNLARTVVVLAVVGALGFRFVAMPAHPDEAAASKGPPRP